MNCRKISMLNCRKLSNYAVEKKSASPQVWLRSILAPACTKQPDSDPSSSTTGGTNLPGSVPQCNAGTTGSSQIGSAKWALQLAASLAAPAMAGSKGHGCMKLLNNSITNHPKGKIVLYLII